MHSHLILSSFTLISGNVGIKSAEAGGNVIRALQDGTPVSIAGSLTDVAGTSSMPTIHSVGKLH